MQKLILLTILLSACSAGDIMPGDPETGCTRMVSKANAGGAGAVVAGDIKYCKYIEQGDCPAMAEMSFELREMCRDM